MMYTLQAYSGLVSMAVPFGIALVRFRKTDAVHQPFLLLLCAGFASELVSFWLVERRLPNLVVINLYVLVEALVITWQFRRWELFSRRSGQKLLYPFLQASFVMWWLYESFVLDSLFQINSYFILYSSFLFLLMSIDVLTREVVFRSSRLWRNAAYLICVGFLFYFTAALLFEIFLMFGLGKTAQFRNLLVLSMAGVNAFTNLVFAYAILCIPTRLRYLKLW